MLARRPVPPQPGVSGSRIAEWLPPVAVRGRSWGGQEAAAEFRGGGSDDGRFRYVSAFGQLVTACPPEYNSLSW